MLATLNAIIGIASFVVSIAILYNQWPHFFSVKIVGPNDDELAEIGFTGLLRRADQKISISDHGNIMDNSIYQNESVLAQVDRKLRENSSFIIECGFTSPDRNKFREMFEGHPRVIVRQREEPILEYPHYKIIDGGVLAYLSRHEEGSDNREICYYDFSRSKRRWGQDDVIGKNIDHYLKDIEDTFGDDRRQNG